MKKYIFEPQQLMANGKLKRYPSVKVWLNNDQEANAYAIAFKEGMRTYRKFVQVLCCTEDGTHVCLKRAII